MYSKKTDGENGWFLALKRNGKIRKPANTKIGDRQTMFFVHRADDIPSGSWFSIEEMVELRFEKSDGQLMLKWHIAIKPVKAVIGLKWRHKGPKAMIGIKWNQLILSILTVIL